MNNMSQSGGRFNWSNLIEKAMLSSLFGLGFLGYNFALYIAVIVYMPSRLVTMPHRALMLGVAMLALFSVLFGGRKCYRGKLWIPLVCFWGAYGLRIIYDNVFVGVLPHTMNYYLLYAYGVCAVPMVAFMASYSRQGMRFAFWALQAFAMGCVLMTLALYGFGGGGRSKGGEFIGDFVAIGPLHLSYMGSAILALGLYALLYPQNFRGVPRLLEFVIIGVFAFFDSKELRARLMQFFCAASLILGGVYLLVLGASRGPVMAVIGCGLFIGLAKIRNEIDVFKSFAVLIVLAVLGVLVLFVSRSMGSALAYRLGELLEIGDIIKYGGFGAERYFLWSSGISQFMESPIVGSGLMMSDYMTYPHNAILEAFMATGIFGGLAFLTFLFGCMYHAYKLLKYAPEYGWVSVLFIHYAMYIQVSSSIGINSYFWYAAAGVLGLSQTMMDQCRVAGPLRR
jgi:hypothetical protein